MFNEALLDDYGHLFIFAQLFVSPRSTDTVSSCNAHTWKDRIFVMLRNLCLLKQHILV